MVSSSTLMASLKALLASAGAVSIAAVALRASVPSVSDPLAPRPPLALDSLLSWFRPPYLFVVVNGIIVAIVATSRCFHHAQPERIAVAEEIEVTEATPVPEAVPVPDAPPVAETETFDDIDDFEEKGVVVVENGGGFGGGGDGYNGDCERERKVAFGRSASTPRRRVNSPEKPLASPRLVRRRAANGDHLQGGKALRRSTKRSNDSMDDVWKAIAGAGAMSMTRHVKPDADDRQISLLDPPPLKSATGKDRANQLRKELSPDELNRRVEAFISKFNEEMRLQRQESMNQLKEMISHGT